MTTRWWLGVAPGALVMAAACAASGLAASPDDGEIADVLIENLGPGAVIEQYVSRLVGRVRSADRLGDGLDREDLMLLRARQTAQARASSIAEVLGYDLNGDFKVTREELAQAAPGPEPSRPRQVESIVERFDGDGDGVVTLAEAGASAREQSGDAQVEALLALDPNRDGKLTAVELRTIAERVFSRIDADGDDTISPSEFKPIEDRAREVRMIRSSPRCDLPPVPPHAVLAAFGVYEGQAISSVAIGGPDQETNLIDVVVEPGDAPLYLVLTSYESMIWRVSGASDRVVRAVVSSFATAKETTIGKAASASGVVGIRRERVTVARSGCPRPFDKLDSSETRSALTSISRALGRRPDAVAGTYSTRRVSLPSGTLVRSERDTAPVPRGFDAATWPDAALFWPGGLVAVDPKRVVATARAETYKVLPSQMGLSQLIGAGAIERTGSGAFRIVKPIAHMPPSMGGAHSVKLIVAKGVPVPPGSPVHSCVTIEGEAAQPDDGPRCDAR
jgi:Ca2+-binding EF-hand superfamily protein